MNQPYQAEDSVEIDVDAMDSPAERLAERYRVLGMSAALAQKLVNDCGVAAFAVLERASGPALPPEVIDGWRMATFQIWQAPKSKLSAGAFLMAVGWMPPGITSQRDLAKLFKVSPEHVSNLVEEWQEKLSLPRTEFQKSAKAVEAARVHHKKNIKHYVRTK